MFKVYLSLTIGFFVTSCGSLSPEVASIETYYLKFRIPSECKVLGEVRAQAGSLMDQDAAISIAEDKLKQSAYDKYKANTLFIRSGSSFGGVNYQASAEGIAYSCPE